MTTTISTVLLGTDGSADAALARRAAVDLAGRWHAALHLVTAWAVPASAYGAPGVVLPPTAFDWPEQMARDIVRREARDAGAAEGAEVTTHVLQGRADDVVLEVCESVGADLVVVGSRGRGPVRRLLLGSVADGVVRGSDRPVLVVRGGDGGWPVRHVVVGLDGSPAADRACDVAALVAGALDVPMTLVGCVAWPGAGGGPGLERLEEDALAVVGGLLDERAASLGATGIAVDRAAVSGDPAATLLDAAAQPQGPVLLAVGRRGLGAVRRALLGSVSNAVLHAAPGPVLVVPRAGAVTETGRSEP